MKSTLGLYLAVFKEPLALQDKLTLNILLNQMSRKYWSMKELSEIMGVSEKTISRSLEELEKAGYIKRQMNEGKRYYITKLTLKACSIVGRKPETEEEQIRIKEPDEAGIMDLFRKVVYKNDR